MVFPHNTLVGDFHIHGKYARATSKDLTIPMLSKYAKVKGVDVLGTGDFQHPEWNKHLKSELTETDAGIYVSKEGQRFLLSSEISFAYTQGGKGRRIHLVVLAPSLPVVDQIAEALLKKGRLDYDGRPIFGMSCIEFVDLMRSISTEIEIIPAHAWTPWFGVFGSKSGFDSLQECFQEKTKYIHAIETGMSSDPSMNWRLSQLDNIQLVSFSDSHSYWPWRIGREATIFDVKKPTYESIIAAIRTGHGIAGTVETDPGYGIYHFDGHRDCGISYSPEESARRKGICEKCGKPVTVGVAARIEELADFPEGRKSPNAKPHTNLIPLSELLAGVLDAGIATKKVWASYNALLQQFPNEFHILLKATAEELQKVASPEVVDIILKNRTQQIKVKPGYDGVYGVPIIGNRALKIEPENPSGAQEAKAKRSPQRTLI